MLHNVPGYISQPGTDCTTVDIIHLENSSPIECSVVCNVIPECWAFVFSRQDSTCHLKGEYAGDELTNVTHHDTYMKGWFRQFTKNKTFAAVLQLILHFCLLLLN